MSKIGQLVMEIEERLNQGMDSATIANCLSVPIEWVIDVEEKYAGPDYDFTEEEQYYAEH